MAVFRDLGLVCVAILMLAAQLDFACATVVVHSLRGKNLPGDALGNKPDPYIKVCCNSQCMETKYFQGKTDPQWNERFQFDRCSKDQELILEVMDKDVIFDDYLGGHKEKVKSSCNGCEFSVGKGTVYFSYEAS